METKKCSNCKHEKNVSEFYSQKGHKFNVMSMCKTCFNQFCNSRWIERKKKYVTLLGGKCSQCNIQLTDSNYSIFDFHHVNPSSKEFTWTKLRLFSDTKVKEELSKCVVLCANCHRLLHYFE